MGGCFFFIYNDERDNFHYQFDPSIITMVTMTVTLSLLLLGVLLGITGTNGKPPSAIVSGNLADDNEFPYLVAIFVRGKHKCGGTIIDSVHILTAAHCFNYEQSKDVVIYSGSNKNGKGNEYRVKSIKIHEKYDSVGDTPWRSDIAIVTLASAIEFNDRQKPISLATKATPLKTPVTASGWGDTVYPDGDTPADLWKLDLNIDDCSKLSDLVKANFDEGQICAFVKSGSGLCVGDSGGPLASDGVLVGVFSMMKPCGEGVPDVFTNVYEYRNWIEEGLKN